MCLQEGSGGSKVLRKGVIEANHMIPFLMDELKPEEAVAGVLRGRAQG